MATRTPERLQRVYLDYAATSPILKCAQEAMRRVQGDAFGNPSSEHWAGAKANEVIEAARRAILRRATVGTRIVFTSGATESNVLGLVGTALASKTHRLLVSSVEHESIAAACRMASVMGLGDVEYIPVDTHGRVRMDELEGLLDGPPPAVAVMHGNNEVGTLQPIEEIARLVHEAQGKLHVDAAQTFCKVSLSDLAAADTISLSAHKIGGPQGVGALLIRDSVEITSPFGGGTQEYGLRHGTHNVAGIAGFARAAVDSPPEVIGSELAQRASEFRSLLEAQIPDIEWTGDLTCRAPHIVSCIIQGVPAQLFIPSLSARGIAASGGSACHADNGMPSHVIRAMGVALHKAVCAVRFSVGIGTSSKELAYASKVIANTAFELRRLMVAAWDMGQSQDFKEV